MTATKQDIIHWVERAKQEKATHLIIAVDKFNYENYPVFVYEGEDVKKKYDEIFSKSLQGVDEVYNMSMNLEEQLAEHRAIHF